MTIDWVSKLDDSGFVSEFLQNPEAHPGYRNANLIALNLLWSHAGRDNAPQVLAVIDHCIEAQGIKNKPSQVREEWQHLRDKVASVANPPPKPVVEAPLASHPRTRDSDFIDKLLSTPGVSALFLEGDAFVAHRMLIEMSNSAGARLAPRILNLMLARINVPTFNSFQQQGLVDLFERVVLRSQEYLKSTCYGPRFMQDAGSYLQTLNDEEEEGLPENGAAARLRRQATQEHIMKMVRVVAKATGITAPTLQQMLQPEESRLRPINFRGDAGNASSWLKPGGVD